MLDISVVEKEIQELEQQQTGYSVCEKLAWLYIILDHWRNADKGVAQSRNANHYCTCQRSQPAFTRETAQNWAHSMENEDGSHGAHWTLEQAKQVMAQKGVTCNPQEFWLALNMMYSDYCKVFRKYGVGDKIDFYVDMAKAFLNDADAYPDKLARYYEYIVRH